MNKLAVVWRAMLLMAGILLTACASTETISAANDSESRVWEVNSLNLIGGHSTAFEGDTVVVDSSVGKVVRFDGNGDRLLVNANPLGDATEFTIEVIFNPADAYPNNLEPRFFHIEAPDNPNRRITIELRLNDKKQWYLDAYIKSEQSQITLIDPTKTHPVGVWAHAAITYKNRQFISYVNGKKELIGEVDYLPVDANAKTSIGARMNRVHWFHGEIAKVRISKKVLQPSEFLLLQ